MPPKRSFAGETPATPPPTQRLALDTGLHLSPQVGHHPDTPEISAAASASPPSTGSSDVDSVHPASASIAVVLSDHQAIAAHGKENVVLLPMHHSSLSDNPSELPPVMNAEMPSGNQNLPDAIAPSAQHPSTTGNAGARAAHHASHQQRVITCNLSLIPPSKSSPHRQSDA